MQRDGNFATLAALNLGDAFDLELESTTSLFPDLQPDLEASLYGDLDATPGGFGPREGIVLDATTIVAGEQRAAIVPPPERAASVASKPYDHRTVLKPCSKCSRQYASRHLSRHSKSCKGMAASTTSSTVASTTRSDPRPSASATRSAAPDHVLIEDADMMIRIRKEFGADVESLVMAGTAVKPQVAEESQRAMALAIHRLSTQTHEFSRFSLCSHVQGIHGNLSYTDDGRFRPPARPALAAR